MTIRIEPLSLSLLQLRHVLLRMGPAHAVAIILYQLHDHLEVLQAFGRIQNNISRIITSGQIITSEPLLSCQTQFTSNFALINPYSLCCDHF